MKKRGRRRVRSLHSMALRALRVAVKKALARHRAAGVPAAVWKNGKVVYLPVASPRRKRRGK